MTIVVDQLGAWVAAERWPLLPADGGFARLRREGTYVRAMRYEHAVTDTAPGHSALYTGAVPEESGIFANEVLGAHGEPESILRDSTVHMLTATGEASKAGSSLAALRVETVADRLRAEDPGATIISLSLKDRGALFGGGRHPSVALWLDVSSNQMVSSSAVATVLPVLVPSLSDLLARAEASTWTLDHAAWVEAHALTPDKEAGEGDLPGYGVVFPHSLATATKPALAFRTSPFADDMLLELGLASLGAFDHNQRTLLAISLSANDYIGHTFGPDSWEAWEELARLDAALAAFLARLDARFGKDGYAVLLTGDHGTNPMPEVGRHPYCDGVDPWQRACGPSFRVIPAELSEALKGSATRALGPGDWVVGVSDPYVYLSSAAASLGRAQQETLLGALRTTLLSTPGIAKAYDIAKVPDRCPGFSDESMDALVCRSVAPAARERGAAFYLATSPGSFFDPGVVVGKGTSHGSPYLYDRTVPFLVRAPGRAAAGRVIDSVTFDAFARTAAELLRVTPPRAAAGGPRLLSPP